MTTNQTIDGVPRELLERIREKLRQTDYTWSMGDPEDELRALLDAPAEQAEVCNADNADQALTLLDFALSFALCNRDHSGTRRDVKKAQAHLEVYRKFKDAQPQGQPVACSHEWTDDGEFTLTCMKCGKTENHEPYGWVQTRGNAINHFTQEWDVVESWEDNGFEYKAMFDHAEQPAPVAVVMPRDLIDSTGTVNQRGYGFMEGWNACLDEVTRLNTK
jgi:hypothetical protein